MGRTEIRNGWTESFDIVACNMQESRFIKLVNDGERRVAGYERVRYDEMDYLKQHQEFT